VQMAPYLKIVPKIKSSRLPSLMIVWPCALISFSVSDRIFHGPIDNLYELNYWKTSVANGTFSSTLFVIALLIARRYSGRFAWRAFWLANAGLAVAEMIFFAVLKLFLRNPNTIIISNAPWWKVFLLNDIVYLLFSGLAFLAAIRINACIRSLKLCKVKRERNR
jgi:hypothetical protein